MHDFFEATTPNKKNVEQPFSTILHRDLVVPLTDFHYRFLLEIYFDWRNSLTEGAACISILLDMLGTAQLHKLVDRADQEIVTPTELSNNRGRKAYFRWRETDFFLQNITAIQLGLREFRQRGDIGAQGKSVLVVGLAFGAIELPAIAQVVGPARQLSMTSALAHISHYGDEAIQKQLTEGVPRLRYWRTSPDATAVGVR